MSDEPDSTPFFGADASAEMLELRDISTRLSAVASANQSELTASQRAELLVEMVNVREQLTRLTGQVADMVDLTAAPLAVGEKSVRSLLRSRCHLRASESNRLLTAGKARYRFPSFHAAFAQGSITLGHIEVMTDMAPRVHSEQLRMAEPYLCAAAVLSTVEEFRDACREWEAAADPTEHLDDYLKAQAAQHLNYSFDLFGNLHLQGTLAPIEGEMFAEIVDRKSDQLYRRESEGQSDAGRQTPSRRRAAALTELVLDGVATPAGSRRPEPVLNIVCSCGGMHQDDGAEPSFGEASDCRPQPPLPSPTNIYPQTLGRRLVPLTTLGELMDRGRTRIIRTLPSGHVLDTTVGAGHDFTPHQKHLIRVRDRACQHPGCATPSRFCQYDHVVPFSSGGPTTVANGQLLCRFHHRWKHRHDPKPAGIRTDEFSAPPRAP